MQSRNPVLSRPNVFSPNHSQQPHPQQYPGQAGYYGQQPGQQYPQQQYAGQQGGYQDPNMYQGEPQAPAKGVMTLDDVVVKTGIMFAVLAVTAAVTWFLVRDELIMPVTIGASLAGLVAVFFVSFRRKVSPLLVIAYAVIEGVFVGGISKMFEYLYEGIVGQAILATFIAAGVTLFAYKFFNIRVTPMFRKIVVIATISFAVFALVNFIFALFFGGGVRQIGGGAGLLAMGISAIAVVLAVLNLILDFDHIERGIEMGAPSEQSWIAAFGLMVTMVWLYIELLRILSYFRD